MINANELRIGNFVYFSYEYSKKRINRVCSIKSLDVDATVVNDIGAPLCIRYDTDSIQPIPLTPEILEKVGFKITPGKLFDYYQLAVNVRVSLNTNGSVPNKYLFMNELRMPCESVHQLQNLFFALTGTELEIKL